MKGHWIAATVLLLLAPVGPLARLEGAAPPRATPVSFTNEVMAVLGKAGCNSGACHGHNSGKGGFKLSLRGYDLAADHRALLAHVDRHDLDLSPLLLKPTAQASHKGGKRFAVGSRSYHILRQWLGAGARHDIGQAVRVERLEVQPAVVSLARPGLQQQLTVRAHFRDGSVRDVTEQAIFELSSEGVIEVTPEGLVSGKREGEAAVFVRFLGNMGLSRFQVIVHKPDFTWSDPPENNFIDRHVHAKLRAIQVLPSALSSDAEFLRRLCLDITGLPPAADEVREFLADQRADKRKRKIAELLEREEFGDVWAAYWMELSGLTPSGDSAGWKGTWTVFAWLRAAINRNLPYDQFVRAVVTGKGSSLHDPGVTFAASRLPRAEVIPHLFMGVRLECAQCHDHPFDVWKQTDYNALREFFTAISTKEGPGDTGGREIRVFVAPERFLPWEMDRKVSLRLPDGQTVEVPAHRDRREVLTDWLFAKTNRRPARALVNRVWGRLLGRGIVEPVDDMRFSNPPVNEALLEALADDFIASRYDFKRLVRTILESRTYQLSSIPNATNRSERMNFSRARLRRLSAEQMLDSISQVTGIDDLYSGGTPGIRAMQLPHTYTGSRFLSIFGRPEQRMSPCECIRSHEVTLAQVLHLLNGETIRKRLRAEDGTLERLLGRKLTTNRLIEELYLTVLSRMPSERELRVSDKHLGETRNQAEGAEDLLWALLTSQEFLFNH